MRHRVCTTVYHSLTTPAHPDPDVGPLFLILNLVVNVIQVVIYGGVFTGMRFLGLAHQ